MPTPTNGSPLLTTSVRLGYRWFQSCLIQPLMLSVWALGQCLCGFVFNLLPRVALTPQPEDALEQAGRKGFSADKSGFEPGGKNRSLELQQTSTYISPARAESHAHDYANHQCDLEGSTRSGCCPPGQPQQMPRSPEQLFE